MSFRQLDFEYLTLEGHLTPTVRTGSTLTSFLQGVFVRHQSGPTLPFLMGIVQTKRAQTAFP